MTTSEPRSKAEVEAIHAASRALGIRPERPKRRCSAYHYPADLRCGLFAGDHDTHVAAAMFVNCPRLFRWESHE